MPVFGGTPSDSRGWTPKNRTQILHDRDRFLSQLKVVPEGPSLILSKSGIEHAEETFLRVRVGGSHTTDCGPPGGGGLEQYPFESPLCARLARPCPAHAVPRSSPLFAPIPRSTWVSLRTARQVVTPNVEELRVCAQGSPVRCGCARCRQARPAAVVRAHTHTSTRAQRCLRSAHTQLAQLPYPPDPPPTCPPFVTCDLSFQRSFGQLKIVNRPTPQTSALFSGPHGLSGSLGTS